jgi:putative photosynthetic complex assembly protein
MRPIAIPPARSPLPRMLVVAVALAMATAFGAALIGPKAVGGLTVPPAGQVVAERTLRFTDRPDKAVEVTEATTGQVLAVFEGEQGFLRGMLRSMARARRMRDIPGAEPLRLTAWGDGRITLDDPSTGEHLELEAFGPTNVAVFTALLPAQVQK